MRTPELVGVMEPSDPEVLRFVVQRQSVGNMHYDLRLEWAIALMSWVVPEGPSINGAVWRSEFASWRADRSGS
jgi:bifunctional non-homologous end joining protein LigD